MLLNLHFKGERKYFRGTDILDETLDWLTATRGELCGIDFSFHRLTGRQIEARLDSREGDDPVARCTFMARGVRERAYLYETGFPVTARRDYSEDDVGGSMEVDVGARRGVLTGASPHSDIEVWVDMAKALHHRVFPNPAGKWLFVRARLPAYARHGGGSERALVIAATFSDRLTRSEIFRDGAPAGEIYFSVGHA